LNKEFSLPVVVTGAGGQKAVCDAIAADQANAVSVAGGTDMAEFAGLLAESAAFVGGDSGGAHVAGALGVPTVVIFGITNPTRTRPQGERVAMVGAGEEKDVKLSTPEAREAARAALAAIPPDRVLEAVREGLRKGS
jgi:ADP-heptose:LPS heptosyltransferase